MFVLDFLRNSDHVYPSLCQGITGDLALFLDLPISVRRGHLADSDTQSEPPMGRQWTAADSGDVLNALNFRIDPMAAQSISGGTVEFSTDLGRLQGWARWTIGSQNPSSGESGVVAVRGYCADLMNVHAALGLPIRNAPAGLLLSSWEPSGRPSRPVTINHWTNPAAYPDPLAGRTDGQGGCPAGPWVS